MIRAQVLLCGIEDVLSSPKVRASLTPSKTNTWWLETGVPEADLKSRVWV